MSNRYSVEDSLTQEEYLKLKGLKAMHDDIQQEQERIWSAVEDILDLVTEIDDDNHFDVQDLAVDAMHSSSLDSYLDKKGFEVEKGEENEQ